MPSIAQRLTPDTRRELGRFILSGLTGSVIGFCTYQLIWYLLPDIPAKATVAWVIGFHIAVLRQHWLHSRFTFPGMRQHFWRTFKGAYAVYAFGLVITTLCHYFVSEYLGFGGNIAWFACYAAGFFLNYPLLKRMVYRHPSPPTVSNQDSANS